MQKSSLHISMLSGAAMLLAACDGDIPARTIPAPTESAPAEAVANDPAAEAMADCLRAAPPRADGQTSAFTADRNDAGEYLRVREQIDGIEVGAYSPEGLPMARDTRTVHLSFCVQRANQALRPVDVPRDEPLFQHQARPQ